MRNHCSNLLCVFSVLVVFILGCEKSTSYEDEITAELEITQEILSIDDTLIGTYTISNYSQETKSFYFTNSCQFGFTITHNGTTFYNEPTGCRASLSELHLISGKSKKFEIQYFLIDNAGNDLPPGKYDIEAFLINTEHKVNKYFQIE